MLWWMFVSPVLAIPGVSPAEETRYHGQVFVCEEGSTKLPSTAVNDDFCDCDDGSDEPGTAACAQSDRWFYCPNEGGNARYVYPSRVGDGICDCCDGSDEWQRPNSCRNVCAEQGRERKARLEQRRAEMQRGIEMRKAALSSMEAEAKAAEAQVAKLDAERAPLLARLKELEEIQKVKRAAVQKEAKELGRDASQYEEEEKKVSEYAKWMEKGEVSEYSKWMEKGGTTENDAGAQNQVCSGTVCVTRKVAPRKVVKEIKVRSGALIDFIEFHYTAGDALSVGEGQGNEQEAFILEPGEVITELHGGQGGLLDRVQFGTNRGRLSTAYGGTGGENFTFKVTEGKMIIGLDRAVGLAGKITAFHEAFFRELTEAEKAFDEATINLEDARRSFAAKESEVTTLRQSLEESIGSHAAYKALKKCGEGTLGEYNYKICPFEDAKQGHVSLGRWKGWAIGSPNIGLFENGERCFSGIVRSLKVHFECGEGYVIESVKEPSQCVYEATMTHPAACDPKDFEVEDRVLGPHEAHIEL